VRLAGAFAGALALTAAAGCATVPVERTFDEAAADAAGRVGARLEWADVSAPAADVEAAVVELLARPLDADGAVQVALLHNRRLQAAYAELGRAAAAATGAGLPPNPFLEVVARFRDGGGTPRLEISIVEEIVDLFLLPARRRLAAVELARAKVDLAAGVVDLVAETRTAFLRYQAERQLLALDRHALLSVEAAWEMAGHLREAGNLSELDLLAERDLYEGMRLEVSRRELAVADLRESLNQRMGLWGEAATAWTAGERLPDLPAADGSPGDPETAALDRSLDLAAALLDLEAAARRLGIADVTAVFPEVEVGAEGEREGEDTPSDADGEWWVGPSVGFRLPVFDAGRARRVGARMELRREWDRLAALGVELRAAARRSAARVDFARAHALHVRDVLLPVRTAVTEQTQLHYNAMFLGVFRLLDAKRREIGAARAWVEALRDYWLARAELDRLLAGRLPADPGARRDAGPAPGDPGRGEGH